ncbi:MAG: hypothetical protein MMC33_003602 [Icmadophila ericetorum]|nr:hypothetical protein [Icmadophila ericetorum]
MSESSGVRNLRAVFEAKAESTSPPSRGRSPIGSEGGRSTSSRPISRIRASFVAVERSGEGGSQLGLRKLSSGGENHLTLDGGSDTKMSGSSIAPEQKEHVKTNGVNGTEQGPLAGVKGEEGSHLSGSKAAENSSADTPSSSQKEPAKKPESEPVTLNVPLRINGDGVNETDNTTKATNNLGSVLKGSPFEAADDEAGPAEEAPKPAKSEKVPTKSNDKKSIVEKGKAEAKDIADKGKAVVKGGPSGSTATTAQSKPIPKPVTINMKKDTSVPAKLSATTAPDGAKSPATASTASKSPITPTRQLPSKTTSPRQPATKTLSPRLGSTATKEATDATGTEETDRKKATGSKPSRMSTASQSSLRTKATTSTSTVPAAKKPAISSSVKPKSPTVPISLSSRLTAPTASSAAKTNGSSRESLVGRTNASTTLSRKPTATKDPPASKPALAKAKPASRPSMTSSTDEVKPHAEPKPADESFLARMMRPTASSASKIHEKVETKSPPRKLAAHKPKRKSEHGGETKAPEGTETAAASTEQHEADAPTESEATASNGLGITSQNGQGEPEPVSTESASAEPVAAAS